MNPTYKETMYVANAAALPASADDCQVAMMLDSQTTVVYSAASNAWNPLSRLVVLKSTVVINAMNTQKTAIYTLPATPLFFYPTEIIPRAVSVSGSGTVPAMSIGNNSPNYNNISSSGVLGSLTAAVGTSSGVPQMANFSPPIAGGATLYANITTGAIGYTAYSIKIDILGFYDNTNT